MCQITWTESTELAINELQYDINAVEEHYIVLKQQLSDLTQLIRGNLTRIKRKMLVALITQDVHGRDIVEKLVDEKIMSPLDFTW